MPLPFILAGAAITAVGYGAKKGYDGYQDKDEAERIIDKARSYYDKHKMDFDISEKSTNNNLGQLGELQIKIGQDFAEFRDIVKDLLNNLEQQSDEELKIDIPNHKLNKIKALEFSTISFLSKAAGGLAGGAAAAYAVYGGVMAVGAASTGTPIAALSGVAAYNATLAAIGGGSLAAGGLGMAGGTAILGGVVAAPVIAIAGWAYASHAKEALKNAQEIEKEVYEAVEKLGKAQVFFHTVDQYTTRIYKETSRIYEIFVQYREKLAKMQLLKNIDYSTYELVVKTNRDGIVKSIENGYKLAAILTEIITTPLFKIKKDKQGQHVEDNNGLPVFCIDNEGQYIVNEAGINSALDKAEDDLGLI